MRRRIQRVVLTAVVVAVALFAIPLAVVVRSSTVADERGELERAALRAAVTVSPDFRQDPVELPPSEQGVTLGLYGVDGSHFAGAGPGRLDVDLARALQGSEINAQTPTELVAAVPVTSGETVIALVRASAPLSAVWVRVGWSWAGLAALALGAAACAGVWAARQSRRLSRPLTDLTRACTDLGEGDLTVRTTPSGVDEIDRAGEALNTTASRLADLIARERAFSAQASHQLRTPLTALRLELESGLANGASVGPSTGSGRGLEVAVRAALASADQLERTIDDVLALARSPEPSAQPLEVDDLLEDLRRRWHGLLASQDRPLRLSVQEPRPGRPTASRAAVRQILDVLVDNAYLHGKGVVTVFARDAGGPVAIDVTDEGHSPGLQLPLPNCQEEPQRLGLAMALALAESQGGRLLLDSDQGHTRFIVLLPVERNHTAHGETR